MFLSGECSLVAAHWLLELPWPCAEVPLVWAQWGAGAWANRRRFRWKKEGRCISSSSSGGCQCQTSPTGAAQTGTGPLPVLCLGQNCFCRGRKVKAVMDLVISLVLLENPRDNPSSHLGFGGGSCLSTNGKILMIYTTMSQSSASVHILILWGLRSPLLVVV